MYLHNEWIELETMGGMPGKACDRAPAEVWIKGHRRRGATSACETPASGGLSMGLANIKPAKD